GCELAFQYTAEVRIDGILPDGAKDSAMVRIAAIIPFLAMKGMAMAGRRIQPPSGKLVDQGGPSAHR
ncbi:MAG: hypothetical protein NTU62_10910, partial [Spirochaetes bacterium]|nr:hypothetical protein [Spirochaetota bacterium]